MIRIAITTAAFEAMKATTPECTPTMMQRGPV
jgi:hypothetical protein